MSLSASINWPWSVLSWPIVDIPYHLDEYQITAPRSHCISSRHPEPSTSVILRRESVLLGSLYLYSSLTISLPLHYSLSKSTTSNTSLRVTMNKEHPTNPSKGRIPHLPIPLETPERSIDPQRLQRRSRDGILGFHPWLRTQKGKTKLEGWECTYSECGRSTCCGVYCCDEYLYRSRCGERMRGGWIRIFFQNFDFVRWGSTYLGGCTIIMDNSSFIRFCKRCQSKVFTLLVISVPQTTLSYQITPNLQTNVRSRIWYYC